MLIDKIITIPITRVPKTLEEQLMDLMSEYIKNDYADLEPIKKIIESGADVNEIACNNRSPFMFAVRWREIPLIEYFLSIGGDPFKKESNSELCAYDYVNGKCPFGGHYLDKHIKKIIDYYFS